MYYTYSIYIVYLQYILYNMSWSCPILEYSNIKTISVWKHMEENEKRPLYRNYIYPDAAKWHRLVCVFIINRGKLFNFVYNAVNPVPYWLLTAYYQLTCSSYLMLIEKCKLQYDSITSFSYYVPTLTHPNSYLQKKFLSGTELLVSMKFRLGYNMPICPVVDAALKSFILLK